MELHDISNFSVLVERDLEQTQLQVKATANMGRSSKVYVDLYDEFLSLGQVSSAFQDIGADLLQLAHEVRELLAVNEGIRNERARAHDRITELESELFVLRNQVADYRSQLETRPEPPWPFNVEKRNSDKWDIASICARLVELLREPNIDAAVDFIVSEGETLLQGKIVDASWSRDDASACARELQGEPAVLFPGIALRVATIRSRLIDLGYILPIRPR